MLLSWLISSLSEDVFSYIIDLKSSYEVWRALALAFGAVSQNRQLQLHIELQELKKNDLSVSDYLLKPRLLRMNSLLLDALSLLSSLTR